MFRCFTVYPLLLLFCLHVLCVYSDTATGECNGGGCNFECTLNSDCFYRLCTGRSAQIKCATGSVIELRSVMFGRDSVDICKHATGTDPQCIPNTAMATHQNNNAMRLCNNETSCDLRAAFNFMDSCKVLMWDDPCPSKAKYLNVNFTCIDRAEINYWSSWGSWSSCSQACDKGSRDRNRTCIDPPEKTCTKSTCTGKNYVMEKVTEDCNDFPCIASTTHPSSTRIQSTSEPLSTSSQEASTAWESSVISSFTSSSNIKETTSLYTTSALKSTSVAHTSQVLTSSPSPSFSSSSMVVSYPVSTEIASTVGISSSQMYSPESSSMRISSTQLSSTALATSTLLSSSPISSRMTQSSSLTSTLSSASVSSSKEADFTSIPTSRIQSSPISSSPSLIQQYSTIMSSPMPSLTASSAEISTMNSQISSHYLEVESSAEVSASSWQPSLPTEISTMNSQISSQVESSAEVSASSWQQSLPPQISTMASSWQSLSSPQISTMSSVISSQLVAHESSREISSSWQTLPVSSSEMLSLSPSLVEPMTSIISTLVIGEASSLSLQTTVHSSNYELQSTMKAQPSSQDVTHSSSSQQIDFSPSPSLHSSYIASSSVIIVTPTDPPVTPTVYVNTSLTLVWARFCDYSDEFRQGIAVLLSERLKEKQDSDQVVIFNMDNCNSNPNETAVVKFYIAVKGSKEPSVVLTRLAAEILLELISNGQTIKVGPHFGTGKFTTLIIVEPSTTGGDDDDEKIAAWLIILIVIAVLIFLIWCCCCICICCRRRKEKNHPKRKYTFTPSYHIEEVPHVLMQNSQSTDTRLNTFSSSISVTVKDINNEPHVEEGIQNPTYEMDELPPKLPPITLILPNGDKISAEPDSGDPGPHHDAEDDKSSSSSGSSSSSSSSSSDENDSSSDEEASDNEEEEEKFPPPPSPGITRVFIGGKLVKEIGAGDADKSIRVSMSTL